MDEYNEFQYAECRDFITSYEFIGYIGGDRDEKKIRAIEVINKKDVAITFIMNSKKENNIEYLIPSLIKHSSFPEYVECKHMMEMTAFITEYSTDKLLSEKIKSSPKLTESEIHHIFTQILDTLAYLHQHHIALGSLSSATVSVGPNSDIKLMNLKKATFFDSKDESLLVSKDIFGLGTCLYDMLFPEDYNVNYFNFSAIKERAEKLKNEIFKRIILYIFSNIPSKRKEEIYKILNQCIPLYQINNGSLLFFDPLVMEYLKDFGFSRSDFVKSVSQRGKKEYYIYFLVTQKFIRETLLDIENISAKISSTKTLDILYDALKKRRCLTNRRREILQSEMWYVSNICNFLECYNQNSRTRISLDLLDNKKYKELCGVLKSLNIRYKMKDDVIDAYVEEIFLKFKIEKFYTYDSFVVEFTKESGEDSDFVQILEEIVDESSKITSL